jgi:metal-responsive CopG/Arc/MetJ family transcriptional regulator
MARISIRIDEQQKQQIDEIARRNGASESDVVREALRQYLRDRARTESCFDIARRIGVIGIAKGLPPDLSTSQKHFEGFGRD